MGLVGRAAGSSAPEYSRGGRPPERGLQGSGCAGRADRAGCAEDLRCLWVANNCVARPVPGENECAGRDEGECAGGRCLWVAGTCIALPVGTPDDDTPDDDGVISEPEPIEPTREPLTPFPTGGPNLSPTDQPTMKPSKSPSIIPTSFPTSKPTARPSDPPTGRPTESPTKQPTKNPTEQPTKKPTERPTNPPTKQPSEKPTKQPTEQPTKKPTERPTNRPTKRPTKSPTEAPSRPPTLEPTDRPTDGPTESPTLTQRPTHETWPSAPPTVSSAPTASPTDLPTAGPRRAPTGRPTAGSTREPSPSPTDAEPTPDPTGSPAAVGTPSPTTYKPTDAGPPERKYEVSSVMQLNGVDALDEDGGEAWIEETEGRIRRATEEVIGEDGEKLVVSVTPDRRSRALSNSAAGEGNRPGQLRRLQSPWIQIRFTTSIEFISSRDEWDPDSMVAAGFITVDQQNEYLRDLKAADGASFGNVTSMAMAVEGTVITEVIVTDPAPLPSDNNIHYIIAGAAGGALLVLVILAVLRKVRSSSSSSTASPKAFTEETLGTPPRDALAMPPNEPSRRTAPTAATTQSPVPQDYFGTVEALPGPDEVSTIGDPYFGDVAVEPRADNTVGESMMSSDRQLYEYGVRRPRLDTGGSTLDTGPQSSMTGRHMFVDDSTFEIGYQTQTLTSREEEGHVLRRLTVVAPSGKLGIVVDNQTMDMPIVHAIKETSVLTGKVNVGDLLVSVDEVDCRGMSAVKVSKLISSRKNNPARTFVLLRGSGGC